MPGGLPKGRSGNPSGLPSRPETIARRNMSTEVKELCKRHTADAVDALVKVMKNEACPPASRVMAANSILDRGWGKPHHTLQTNVSVFDRMSERELLAYIVGDVVEGELLDDSILEASAVAADGE